MKLDPKSKSVLGAVEKARSAIAIRADDPLSALGLLRGFAEGIAWEILRASGDVASNSFKLEILINTLIQRELVETSFGKQLHTLRNLGNEGIHVKGSPAPSSEEAAVAWQAFEAILGSIPLEVGREIHRFQERPTPKTDFDNASVSFVESKLVENKFEGVSSEFISRFNNVEFGKRTHSPHTGLFIGGPVMSMPLHGSPTMKFLEAGNIFGNWTTGSSSNQKWLRIIWRNENDDVEEGFISDQFLKTAKGEWEIFVAGTVMLLLVVIFGMILEWLVFGSLS
jgi:hypothetical protein